MPSATFSMEALISFRVLPLASSCPTWRFLLSLLEHVAMRSPIPAKPDRVIGCAPAASPKRDISANPRVMNAALVLSPYPRPSHMPAPIAIIFYSAPPSSTPVMSLLV